MGRYSVLGAEARPSVYTVYLTLKVHSVNTNLMKEPYHHGDLRNGLIAEGLRSNAPETVAPRTATLRARFQGLHFVTTP